MRSQRVACIAELGTKSKMMFLQNLPWKSLHFPAGTCAPVPPVPVLPRESRFDRVAWPGPELELSILSSPSSRSGDCKSGTGAWRLLPSCRRNNLGKSSSYAAVAIYVRAAVVNNMEREGSISHLINTEDKRLSAQPLLFRPFPPSPRPQARNPSRDQAAFKCHRLIKGRKFRAVMCWLLFGL